MYQRDNAEKVLVEYYKKTAQHYDREHALEPEHLLALSLISGVISSHGYESVLDTGCGTGRGLKYLMKAHPHLRFRGNDLSPDLLSVAQNRNGIPSDILDIASSYSLPYPDESFDLVVSIGLLHHVEFPERVLGEMLRVGRRCIAVSDSNMFAQGGIPLLRGSTLASGLIKTILCRTGAWRFAKQLLLGRSWSYSEGDGVYFTYSIFDSIKYIRERVSSVVLVPTAGGKYIHSLPLFSATHGLLLGFKD